MRASTIVAALMATSVVFAAPHSLATRQRANKVCPARDDEGGTLTSQTLGSDGNLQCDYTVAGGCEYFAGNGNFSQGASTCPDAGVDANDPAAGGGGGATTTRPVAPPVQPTPPPAAPPPPAAAPTTLVAAPPPAATTRPTTTTAGATRPVVTPTPSAIPTGAATRPMGSSSLAMAALVGLGGILIGV
jgi:hypothetical protein